LLVRSWLQINRLQKNDALARAAFAVAIAEKPAMNCAALNCVYLVVCWIDRWPSQSWMRRVSCPALADRRTLALARAAFAATVAEKPAGRFTIRSRTRVVKQHPEGDS
jgi:hypothetical protein